eukprot:1192239-Prorocentrum_minimum.AAC.4
MKFATFSTRRHTQHQTLKSDKSESRRRKPHKKERDRTGNPVGCAPPAGSGGPSPLGYRP